jgi:DNA repair protein RadC
MGLFSPILFRDPGFIDRMEEPALVSDLIRPALPADYEQLVLLTFDRDARLLHLIAGPAHSKHRALLAPDMVRAVFSDARAATLLLAHNHLSGDPQPSKLDLAITRDMARAATLAGLVLTDHVIIAEAGHFSFRAAGLL